jgi:hypothetical protein
MSVVDPSQMNQRQADKDSKVSEKGKGKICSGLTLSVEESKVAPTITKEVDQWQYVKEPKHQQAKPVLQQASKGPIGTVNNPRQNQRQAATNLN